MICKNCETENPEGAVYCKNCGKRLDGTIACPSCGHLNPDDAKVCVMCGKRIVPQTDAPVKAKAESAPVAGEAQAEKAPAAWKKWVELAGGICAMIGIFVVLLCAFLVGVKMSYSSDFFSASESQTIWYYFGDAWKELSDMEPEGLLAVTMYMEAVFGLLISIGMLICTLVFSILAAVRFGMKTAGKSQKDYFGCAVAAVLSFITGAALLVALDAASAEGMSVGLNEAGVAGITCGVLFLCLCIATRIVIKGKALLTKKSILQLAFSAGALVLLSIAVAFATMPACSVSGDSYELEGSGAVSFLGWAASLAVGAEYMDELVLPYALSLVAMIAQLVVVVVAMGAIGSRMKNLVAEKTNSGLASSIWLTVISAIFMILAIAALAVSADKLEMEDGFNYAYIIVEFVFAALSIVVAAVYKILGGQKKKA